MDELLGKMTTPKLVMRDEPNVGLRRLTARSSDTIKGVGSSLAEVDGGQAGEKKSTCFNCAVHDSVHEIDITLE